jgi:hypothetical protein
MLVQSHVTNTVLNNTLKKVTMFMGGGVLEVAQPIETFANIDPTAHHILEDLNHQSQTDLFCCHKTIELCSYSV